MEKILGLDLGTNSIGWAVVEREGDSSCSLVAKGVNVFKDGVAHDKSGEKPAVEQRTAARASRRSYFRRRLRKIELLKVLVKEGLCPFLSDEALAEWKQHKKYPMDTDFMAWQRTDDNIDKNPYHDRHRSLNEVLNLDVKADRYCLGRALYHLNQRRGFQSNRKDSSSESDGVVKKGISDLSQEMAAAGFSYVGDYFYDLYRKGGKIRTTYTSRDEHVHAEFVAICRRQNLPDELVNVLERAIFFQRPLKSQKGLVGKCTFESGKPRCQVSHPRFEEFRMYSFINGIKVKSYLDEDFRPLNEDEVNLILPLFYRKSSPQFEFEDIAKKIAGKNNYCYRGDEVSVGYRFNYRMNATVSGCPVSAALMASLSSTTDMWLDDLCTIYVKGGRKSADEILNDVWHVLATYDKDDMLSAWLMKNLQMDEKQASGLVKARIPQGYASMSLKAVNNILPYLRRGYRYDEAVFMGNLPKVMKMSGYSAESAVIEAENAILTGLNDFYKDTTNGRNATKEKAIENILLDRSVSADALRKLYHPSVTEIYKNAMPDDSGRIRLGSPRVEGIRNPMAMRSLFRLRVLVNRLLDEGIIDNKTKINIEYARGLNDANRRAAMERYNRDLENEYKKYSKEIKDLLLEETGKDVEPTEDDLLKYKLWMEQGKMCLYTGKQISVSDFIGEGNRFDIEHTIPRSRGGDDAQVNKTICDNKFNREIKKGKIPYELAEHAEVMARIESLGWQAKVDSLRKGIEAQKRRAKAAETKSAKDAAIQQKHYLQMQLDYWQGKLSRFRMHDVPEGFSNRQGVDIGIISKYAGAYLKTVFPKVYSVKGATTADFRKMWGLQKDYEKKQRVNHAHHCIDAIVIACIGKSEYDRWARFCRAREDYMWNRGQKPVFDKPWPSFTEDVKTISDELLVYHYTPDNMMKETKRKLRVNGRIQYGADGQPLYVTGDTARASLHQQTFYGAIEKEGEVKYVIRKSLDSITDKDVKNIVDDVVRQKVMDAVAEKGFKAAVAEGVWMNEEKRIPIRKVRLYAPTVVSPLHVKHQRDESAKEYKRDYHVANDGNYCMAIYGDTRPSFVIVNNFEAVRKKGKDLVPEVDTKGRSMKYLLKVGTMVLLYEKDKSELLNADRKELVRRLYEVTGMAKQVFTQNGRTYSYGVLSLKHCQEARRASDVVATKGVWRSSDPARPVIAMQHTQLNAMVIGDDFIMNETGNIKFIQK